MVKFVRERVYSTLLVQDSWASSHHKHFINESSLPLFLVRPLKNKKPFLCAEKLKYSVKSGKFHWLSIIFLTCQSRRCAKHRGLSISFACSFCLLNFFGLENNGKKVRLKDCKAIKNFMCHFDGVCGQVSPTDWPLMKSMKGFACVWHWNPTRVL